MINLVHRHNDEVPLLSDFGVIMWTSVDLTDLFLIHMINFLIETTSCCYFICGSSISAKEKFSAGMGKL